MKISLSLVTLTHQGFPTYLSLIFGKSVLFFQKAFKTNALGASRMNYVPQNLHLDAMCYSSARLLATEVCNHLFSLYRLFIMYINFLDQMILGLLTYQKSKLEKKKKGN